MQNLSDLVTYANPLQGTDSTPEFSNGNTAPLIAMPWGMTHWAVQTKEQHGHGSWMFRYGDHKIQGIRATHQPSPWITDYGHFSIMPVVGEVVLRAEHRSSSYRQQDLDIRPDHLSVYLRRYGIQLEMSPTERCSHFRLTFPKGSDARLLVQSILGPAEVKWHEDGYGMEGSVRGFGDEGLSRAQIPDDFRCHLYIKTDRKIRDFNATLGNDRHHQTSLEGDLAGAELIFEEGEGPLHVQIGTSFISAEQAKLNLEKEIGAQSFEQTQASAKQRWNDTLGRISIEGASEDQKGTFYSALYRSLLFPRQFHEFNAEDQAIHYSPYTGKVEPGVLSADNGFWDTFRTVYPLLALAYPDQLSIVVEGWVNAAKEGGFFPKWASPGYRACMIGTHIDAVVADAMVKNIQGFDKEAAYKYVLKNGTITGPAHRFWGRLGLEHMREKGYVPCDLIEHGSARSLEFAYNDYCVAQCAKIMGDTETEKTFLEHSKAYKNVYDPEVGLMRGKLADGSWRENFDPQEWSGPFCEGASIQYSYMVPHDVDGLIELMGGKEAFVKGIEDMLTTEPTFNIGHYICEVHEMSEMAAVDFGQYAHCNQPSHHILYLLALAGRPDLTNRWVRKVIDELYSATPDGLPGDEDNGEMSAWYVMSALGLYSVCPGKEDLVLACPRFEKTTIAVPGQSPLVIRAQGPVETKTDVSSIEFNGNQIEGPTISHNLISAGGEIVFHIDS